MPSSNSIVNQLIRAAASIPTDISDAELDAHIAELLAKEAKEKEGKWRELGLSAYIEDPTNDLASTSLPKPNKRFLSSIIRTVDDHNATLLRSQADAARDARRKLYDAGSASPSSSRRATDREDLRGLEGGRRRNEGRPASGASRMFAGALGTAVDSRNRQAENAEASRREQDGRVAIRSGRYERERSTRDQEERRRSRSRDRDRRHLHHLDKREDVTPSDRHRDPLHYDDRSERSGRKGHREDSPRSGRRREPDENSASRSRGDKEADQKEDKYRPWKRSVDEEDIGSGTRSPTVTRTRLSDLPQGPTAAPTKSLAPPESKMDKYFEATYDPRFDYSAVLPVPKDGLVGIGSSVEVGWDGMLDVLKSRGKKKRAISPMQEDRDPYSTADPRPMSSLRTRRSPSPAHQQSKHSRRHAHSGSDSDSSEARERCKRKQRKERERMEKEAEERRLAALDGYKYAKRGQDREWDKDKKAPT